MEHIGLHSVCIQVVSVLPVEFLRIDVKDTLLLWSESLIVFVNLFILIDPLVASEVLEQVVHIIKLRIH
jgi:hypothetical protein